MKPSMNSSFTIDEKILNESYKIDSLKLSDLFLKNCQEFIWVLLVPRKPLTSEVYELTLEEQHLLIEEISMVSQILKTEFKADKINIATFGNVVSQLHIHIIARHYTDLAWPNNPWTCQQTTPYLYQEANALIDKIKHLL